MKNIFLAIDGKINEKEFYDKIYIAKEKLGENLFGIKLNSMYHWILQNFSNGLNGIKKEFPELKLFFDLKLYDTPKTIIETIENLQNCDYLTISLCNYNQNSVAKGIEKAKEKGIFVYIVQYLSTTNVFNEARFNLNIISLKFLKFNKKFENFGLVVPYIEKVDELRKNFEILVPGVYLNRKPKNYSDQKFAINYDKLKNKENVKVIIGRGFR